MASVKQYPEADPDRIGMWGHSMGGHITLRNMVVNKDVKAGVIWAGVVASYPDLLYNWRRRGENSISPTASNPAPTEISTRGGRGWRTAFINEYGDPQENPEFWNSISSNTYLNEVSGPIQIHHGTADTSVPYSFAQSLHDQMQAAGKESELYLYENDDHDITANFGIAMERSIAFFDTYLKGEQKN